MCELTIIVAVYNAQQYIERTVKALLTQQLDSYEILLVDDGSPDDSGKICDSLAECYENVRSIHIVNSGPGHARNIGIENAKGSFVAFCDSDDVPADNMYGLLLQELKHNNVQLSLCDIYSERDSRRLGFPWVGNQLFDREGTIDTLLASMLGNQNDDVQEVPVWGSSVRSIYDKRLIEKHEIRFPEDIRFAEDLVFNVRYLAHCSSSFVLDKVLYRYTFNRVSLMNSYVKYNPRMFDERLKLIAYIEECIRGIDTHSTLQHRFMTSQRCYFHEAVGNAARAIKSHGSRYAYREIKAITSHAQVKMAFANLRVRDKRKRLVYGLIRHGCNLLLLAYYALRLK